MSILVIGDVMVDVTVQHSSHRGNSENAASCTTGTDVSMAPGGAALVAQLIKAMGSSVALEGLIGNDCWGDALLLDWRFLTVDCSGWPTTTKIRSVDEEGNILSRIDIERPVKAHVVADLFIGNDALLGVKCVVLSDYHKSIFWDVSDVQSILDRCGDRGIPVVIDPHPGGDPGMWFSPNCQSVSLPNVREFSQNYYPTMWCGVTEGPRGIHLFGPHQHDEWIPVDPIESPMCVGAGDAVTAAVAVGLARGLSIPESVKLGARISNEYVRHPRGWMPKRLTKCGTTEQLL